MRALQDPRGIHPKNRRPKMLESVSWDFLWSVGALFVVMHQPAGRVRARDKLAIM